MDKLNKQKRGWNMSRIHSKNTKPELIIRKLLFNLGYRYRIHYLLDGKPDIVFPKQKIAIFINGCFWHSHGCKNSGIPKSNTSFWSKKLLENVERDRKILSILKRKNWKPITIWECEIEKNLPKSLRKIEKLLQK